MTVEKTNFTFNDPIKYVYFFGVGQTEGRWDQKQLLGGKGSGLAGMTSIQLPVPPGFTLSTEACSAYYTNDKKWPDGLEAQVRDNISRLERLMGKNLGDTTDPLLISVRSGAPISMPGMMETILNLGLNDQSVEGLAQKTKNPRFAYDSYRRFIMMYASTAKGLDKDHFEDALDRIKRTVTAKRLGRTPTTAIEDIEVSAEELHALCKQMKMDYQHLSNEVFPQDPWEQLVGAINAVFNSWMADKAVTYRKVEKIRDAEIVGTAVNICTMVFGNKGEGSGTGVAFTRDPNSGENEFYGDYLFNAQGEDVVAGIRTPVKLSVLGEKHPEIYQQLLSVREKLEMHHKEMQDIEFTVEEGTLYMLQTRRGKRTANATFKIAVDMVNEGLINETEALKRIRPEDIERLFYPEIDSNLGDTDLKAAHLATGINAVPGAAAGKVYFSAEDTENAAKNGERVLLVRKETRPEDVGGMYAARGILTKTGGKTSHAAVVARGWGKSCIVGCEALNINYQAKQMRIGDELIREGDYLTLDGSTGAVYKGDLALVAPTPPKEYEILMAWADKHRRIRVRTNADTPEDAVKAIKMGAEGIGLCRTEHMFFDSEERRDAIQEMILSNTSDARIHALNKLLPFQRNDFEDIFTSMDTRPVTIRLIDPPLHEFVPQDSGGQRRLAGKMGITFHDIHHRIELLNEFNPMLGHRGCRLAISYPEILEMQVRAIIEAACNVVENGIRVHPEIMIPLTIDGKEMRILADQVITVADRILARRKLSKESVPYLVGTMIETPRAALMADSIAETAEFFSFGTNDLTQSTMSISRDDAGHFLPDYVDESKAAIFRQDPFQTLDQEGVGQLLRMGIERGRRQRPYLKIGICGEHGGDAESVKFCVSLGMDYVSCSPYRVPIARLAAAQAALSMDD